MTWASIRHLQQARTLDSGAVKVSAVACTDVVGELLKCQEEGHEPVQLPGADELAALSTEILEEYASRASDFGDRVVQSIAQIVRHR